MADVTQILNAIERGDPKAAGELLPLVYSHMEFHEMHKFEENIDDNLIFRARKGNMHIVYCVTKDRKMIFLRAVRNYDEYKKLLEDKGMLKKLIGI